MHVEPGSIPASENDDDHHQFAWVPKRLGAIVIVENPLTDFEEVV
jgi:hypothetical protein